MSEYPPGSFELADRIVDLKVAEAHRDAQEQRLRRQAGAGRAHKHRFYCAALARLGVYLSAWGMRLQEHYSADDSTPTLSAAD